MFWVSAKQSGFLYCLADARELHRVKGLVVVGTDL